MRQPKQLKWRKPHKVSYKGKAKRGTTLAFGQYGIQAKEGAWITARQIEATRIAITRYLQRFGKVHIRIFPQQPMTKKPLEVRMGKGKGSIDHYVAVVKEGMILFEIESTGGTVITEEKAREALRLGSHKLPIKTRFVMKEEK